MPQLIKKEGKLVVADHLRPADGLWARIKGLIGESQLKNGEAFWIPACPSIHTFFMKFPIDVVFTDKNFQIVSLCESALPGKILFGGLKSCHVFELKEGAIKAGHLKKGDCLYVEH